MAIKMDAYNAVAVLDGFADDVTAADVLAASRYIRDHGPRGILTGNGTTRAIALADYADKHGDAEALDVLEHGAF